jgi:hypothetical protein
METEYIDLSLHESDNPNGNILFNPLELFFQEIELAIQIGPGEIWGIKENINISRYVFNRFVTLTQIRNEITNYLSQHCQHSKDFKYFVETSIINFDGKDLIYIAVKVVDVYEQGDEFLQKFLLGTK